MSEKEESEAKSGFEFPLRDFRFREREVAVGSKVIEFWRFGEEESPGSYSILGFRGDDLSADTVDAYVAVWEGVGVYMDAFRVSVLSDRETAYPWDTVATWTRNGGYRASEY